MKEGGFKSGFVVVVGRPSTGKSSLINALCGHKVAIVSPTPQTTRNKIRGIITTERGQAVFLDTPGLHNSRKRFNRHMRELVLGGLEEVDGVLYVLDLSRPVGREEEFIAGLVRQTGLPVVVCLNKADLPRSAGGPAHEELIAAELPNATQLQTSAVRGEGLAELRDAVLELLPDGEALYPEEFYTDQDPEFRVAELIREQAVLQTRQELPHALYVEISDMELRERSPARRPHASQAGQAGQAGGQADEEEPEEQLWIRAFLIVERESQKGMLVGKGGRRIKEIRQAAQREIGRVFPYRVHLDLRVKVNPGWRRQEHLLTRLVN